MAGLQPAQAQTVPVTVEAKPVATALWNRPLADAPDVRVTGAWALSSPDFRFGGLSGIAWSGGELWMVSDAGWLVRLPSPPDGGGTLAALYQDLPAICGSVTGERLDAEAIAPAPDGSGMLVALETHNGLCHLPFNSLTPATFTAVPAMSGWEANRGSEVMAVHPDGAMVISAPPAAGEHGSGRLLWLADGASGQPAKAVARSAETAVTPTDAAFLADGRLVLLERRYRFPSGYESIVSLISLAEQKATPHFRLRNGPFAGNHEGLAVVEHPLGATLWMVTDSNFFPRRKTLLLRLEWSFVATSGKPPLR